MAISFQISAQLSLKMRGYPQFSFWVLMALAKICFFHIVLSPCKNIVVLVGKFLKKPEYPEMRRTYKQEQKEAPSLNLITTHESF